MKICKHIFKMLFRSHGISIISYANKHKHRYVMNDIKFGAIPVGTSITSARLNIKFFVLQSPANSSLEIYLLVHLT